VAVDAKILTARLVIFDCIMENEDVNPEKCSVSPEEFIKTVEDMDNEGLITKVGYSKDGRGKTLIAFLNTAEITPKGESYLEHLVEKYG
jgi:hypothetical protein